MGPVKVKGRGRDQQGGHDQKEVLKGQDVPEEVPKGQDVPEVVPKGQNVPEEVLKRSKPRRRSERRK